MAILSKGTDFTTGDQVTAAKLDELVDNATFASGAVDDSTTQIDGSGRIIVKDGGITSAKLNLNDAVTITDSTSFLVFNNTSQDVGFIGTDSGTGNFFINAGGSTDQLVLKTNGVSRATIDNDGDVRVFGQTSNGNAVLRLLSSAGNISTLQFGVDGGDEDVGAINYDHSSNDMIFRTNTNERMRIKTEGNVGIGTTSPTEALQVVGDIKATNGTQFVLLNDNGSIELNHASNAFIDFKNDASEDFDSRIFSNSNGLAFSTGGDGSTATRMTIASDGKVGIGATSPAQELEVVGDITANSLIAREASTDNSLRLLSDPEAPDGTNGGSQIELFAQEASTASQIYHKARFHKFQTIGSSATDVLDIATDSGHLKLYNIPGSAPSTPSGGGVLYVQSGALKYKGSGGTETTIAPA